MPRYTDELDALKAHEGRLRREIARRIAEDAGAPAADAPTEAQMAAADSAIENWAGQGEEEQDLAAFRPIGPLQRLLAEHRQVIERIQDLLDRRLS